MIKNLIYGTLAAGGVAAATALVLTTSSSEPPTTCKVTLDANGGTFGSTNVFCKTTDSGTPVSNVFNKADIPTYENHDFEYWTVATNSDIRVPDDALIVSNTNYYAKWKLSDIQKHNVTNDALYSVAKFPVVFYGKATKLNEGGLHPTTVRIRFISPTNKYCRISFDPSSGKRVSGSIAIADLTEGTDAQQYEFGDNNWPVNFGRNDDKFTFKQGHTNELCLTMDKDNWGTGNVEANYAIGIDLEGCLVKFHPSPYGDLGKWAFYDEGIYVSTNFPLGILPKATVADSYSATFDGWWTTEENTGMKVLESTCPGSCLGVDSTKWVYAHWTFSSYDYYVDFDANGENVDGTMPVQTLNSGNKYQRLQRNRFYKQGYKFAGWAKDKKRTSPIPYFANGALGSELNSRPYATNYLYAVWEKVTGRANYFVTSSCVTNFTVDAVSNDVQLTEFEGIGSVPTFYMNITNMTNSVDCRVAIDPVEGYSRTNATLVIDRKLESGAWTTNLIVVTDLSTKECRVSFTNGAYRLTVKNTPKDYPYVVSVGKSGSQIKFNSCGETVSSYNWTAATPYGYSPTMKEDKNYGAFLGWYKYDDITKTNKYDESEHVVSDAVFHAHWANQPYTVKFDGNGATNLKPYTQGFRYSVPQVLSRNRFYLDQHRFSGWSNDVEKVIYADGATVTNLCAIAGGTNTLYAVWQPTPGTNWYYVAGTMTNFANIVVSQGKPTYFFGKGDTTQFMVTTTNVAKCRVAIDPQEGFSRTGAKLTIDCAEISTNKTKKLVWKNACEVSDLSDKEVTCAFTTNHYYRFVISGLASATNGYVVSIGAEGARYIFDACGGNFVGEKETTKVKFYNWTVGSSIAYAPPVTTNAYVHGTNSWHYTPQRLTEEPKLFSVTNAVVSGGEKLYAHWSDAVIVELVFDWNLSTCGIATNIVFTNYYGQGSDVYLYKDAYVRQPTYDNFGFLGWTTNATTTAGWNLDAELQPVTTNSPSYFYAQWTKEWRTSRTEDAGLSIDGYYGTLGSSLDIPKQVKTVGGVEWPVSVTAIGDSAFTNCLFATLSLPPTLTSIGSSAFCGCSAFSTLDIPETVTYVGDSAFEDCTSLATVTFPTAYPESEYAESGFLDGIIDPSSPSVELGTCLFKGCTSLSSVELPLGVNCIPDECFGGCTSLMSFDAMPYTVITIGEEAFAGCTHLTNVVHTEIVDEIGSGAYERCARLKFASFIGDQPESVSSDIFSKTPRNVLVRYLSNMCTTAKDYCGGSWPALPSLWPNASSTNSSRRLTWLGGKYPRRKVVFNYNDNATLWQSTQVPVLYHSGRVFGLLAPTEDEMNGGSSVTTSDDDSDDEEEGEEGEEEEEKTGFSGWWTQPIGGRRVGNYWEVPTASEGDSAPITVYAHWGEEKAAGETEIGSRSSEEYPVLWPGADGSEQTFDDFTGFYSADDDMFYYSACTFNGVVIDLNNENMMTGTVVFAFQDGTYPADGGVQSAFTATITWNGGKKTTISGVADAEGYLVSKSGAWSFGEEGDEQRTVITKSGINGWLTNGDGDQFRIYAARSRYAQATSGAAKSVVLTGLQATKGTWHVVLEPGGAPIEAEDGFSVGGYCTLSITIANMGKATVTGTLGDGTSVSTTSTLIIGDGCCCLPVSIRPYGGKGGFSFMLWFAWSADGSFGEDEASVQALTEWDASMSSHPFTTGLELAQPLTFIDEKRYSGNADFECDKIATVKMTAYDTGKKWKIADGEENPDKLKVSYNPTTGLFTGSFAVESDEGKKVTAMVNGAFTDSITSDGDIYYGYGTAVIKGVGSVPVTIETTSAE